MSAMFIQWDENKYSVTESDYMIFYPTEQSLFDQNYTYSMHLFWCCSLIAFQNMQLGAILEYKPDASICNRRDIMSV